MLLYKVKIAELLKESHSRVERRRHDFREAGHIPDLDVPVDVRFAGGDIVDLAVFYQVE